MIIIAALDDISGETVAYVIDLLLEKGANNVHVSQTVTKKGRTGLLFFIDVNKEKQETISEIIMMELGSTGYNIITTKHVHTQNKVSKHTLIINVEEKSLNESIQITSSYSPKGELVKIDPKPEDLKRIIERAGKELGINLPFRELKRKIKKNPPQENEAIILEL
ncbi:MAG: nickel pincer cofactor biosynthesis protein LarC2 [Candidatus Hermodarchaeia archaeon]|jgi:uncharacterized protein (DUF111 family)